MDPFKCISIIPDLQNYISVVGFLCDQKFLPLRIIYKFMKKRTCWQHNFVRVSLNAFKGVLDLPLVVTSPWCLHGSFDPG